MILDRLVWASHSTGVGGAERALAELLAVAVEAELVGRALVVVPKPEGPLLDKLDGIDRVEVHVSPMAAWMTREHRSTPLVWRRHVKNLVVASSLVRQITRFRASAALTNTLTIPSLALAARRAGVPHGWFAHEFGTRHHVHLGDRTWQTVRRTGRALLVPSRTLGESLSGQLGLPVHIVPPLVLDGRPEGSVTRPAGSVLVIGDANPDKGVVDVIESISRAVRGGADLTLTIVGAGDRPTELRQAARDAGIGDRCTIVAAASDMGAYYSNHHIVVCPSRFETFGRVPAEALWHGCGLIVNDIPVWREWLPDHLAVFTRTHDHGRLARDLASACNEPVDQMTGPVWAASTFSHDRAADALRVALGALR